MIVWSPVLVPELVPVISEVRARVPVVAGAVKTTPVPATALGWIVTSPEVFPYSFNLPIVVAFLPIATCVPSML